MFKIVMLGVIIGMYATQLEASPVSYLNENATQGCIQQSFNTFAGLSFLEGEHSKSKKSAFGTIKREKAI